MDTKTMVDILNNEFLPCDRRIVSIYDQYEMCEISPIKTLSDESISGLLADYRSNAHRNMFDSLYAKLWEEGAVLFWIGPNEYQIKRAEKTISFDEKQFLKLVREKHAYCISDDLMDALFGPED